MKNMKKTLALVLTFVVILTCFVACKKEDEEKVKPHKNFAGEAVAVVTEKDGGIIRDDVGNVVVYVTEKDGVIVKNEDGEPETKHQAIEHAIVTGRRIEMADYAINIPDGWSDAKSYSVLNISKDGTDKMITIMADRNASLTDNQKAHDTIVSASATGNIVRTTQTVAGQEASVVYTYSQLRGNSVFVGYIDFSRQGVVYSVQVSSTEDISSSWNEIVSIVNTIEFVH